MPNKEESLNNNEEVLLLEKEEGKELKDKNYKEGELLTINIEKAETLDNKAKEA